MGNGSPLYIFLSLQLPEAASSRYKCPHLYLGHWAVERRGNLGHILEHDFTSSLGGHIQSLVENILNEKVNINNDLAHLPLALSILNA
jgi:hypothetical protein